MSKSDAAIVARWSAKRAWNRASEKLWKARHTYRDNKVKEHGAKRHKFYAEWQHLKKSRPAGDAHRAAAWHDYRHEDALVSKWEKLRAEASKMLHKRRARIAYCTRVIERHTDRSSRPLRRRALAEAHRLIGVMEHGGNNRGAEVTRIIRENGGTGPEPWCGDFVAHCYRKAGSKVVQRLWASVYWLGRLAGLAKTTHPRPGDIVRFTFSHTGIFEKDNGDGTITTIEGNTGPTGAVSDSSTGGDGVYRKVRSKSLVLDYRHVTR